MKTLEAAQLFGFFQLEWTEVSHRLSMTLLHSLWQGLIVAAIAAIALRILVNFSSRSKYMVSVIALMTVPFLALVTFCLIETPSVTKPAGTYAGTIANNDSKTAYDQPTKAAAESASTSGEYTSANSQNSENFYVNIVQQKNFNDQTATAQKVDKNDPKTKDLSAGNSPNVLSSNKSLQSRFSQTLSSMLPWVGQVLPWFAIAYVLGVTVMLFRLGINVFRSSRLRADFVPIDDKRLTGLVNKLALQMRLRTVPAVCFCESLAVPAVLGIVKPIVLLPPALVTNLTIDELAAILCHEFAHIRRFDPIVLVIQRVVEALLFFNPAVWWLSKHVSNERENCCDDIAASTGFGNLGYVSALMRIAELCVTDRNRKLSNQLATLYASGNNANQLSRRIERLLNIRRTNWVPKKVPLIIAIGIATAMVSVVVLGNSNWRINPIASGISMANPEAEKTAMTNGRAVIEAGNTHAAVEVSSLQKAIKAFNRENERLERGLGQTPLSELEVVSAIQKCEWNVNSGWLNEEEFASMKKIVEAGELPPESYFAVRTFQQTETFLVKHYWRIELYLPAIGHDGFVPFVVRDTQISDEAVDPDLIAWGEPDQDGWVLGGYLSPQKEKYQLGDRVRLLLFVRNDGEKRGSASWSRLTEPGPDAFSVLNEQDDKVKVHLGHEKWRLPMVSGAIGGGLGPGDTHYLNVPFEIRIGMRGTQDKAGTNKLIGAIVDAKAGQKIRMSVLASTGNNNTRRSNNPWSKTGDIKFEISETSLSDISEEYSPPIPSRTASGIVVDHKGNPVADATLVYRLWNEKGQFYTIERSDKDGKFSIEYDSSAEFDSFHTWVYAEGHGVRVVNMRVKLKSLKSIEDVEIRLPKNETTTVKFLRPDGSPLKNVSVRPYSSEVPNGKFAADISTGLTTFVPEPFAEMLEAKRMIKAT